jgi:DNA-binding GntR family transcriptional regulator
MPQQPRADRSPAQASRSTLAAERIATMIMSGELRDGDRLVEEDLASRLGMSRLPIREALRTLTQEGLVTVLPRRGAFVTSYGRDEMVEVYDVRAVLLGFAARLVAQSIEPERLDELERILGEMREAVAAGDYDSYVPRQQRLRRIIWASTPNRLLRDLIWQVWRRGLRLRVIAIHLPGRLERSLHAHEQIVRAIRDRDSLLAERAMWMLCMDAKQSLLDQYFGDDGGGDAGHPDPALKDLSAFEPPTMAAAPRRRRRR